MARKKRLSEKEERVLELLWERNTSLTSVEMFQYLEPLEWSDMSIYRAINSLMVKDLIRVCGKELYHSQYARRFEPTITKEEYIVHYLYRMKKSTIAQIVTALIKEDVKEGKGDEELLTYLESIVQKLRDKQGK